MITLGQRESDNISQMVTIQKVPNTIRLIDSYFGLSQSKVN